MKTSKDIDVSNNPLGKKGAEAFEDGIDKNEYILEFDARMCELGKQTEDYLSHWLKRNVQLRQQMMK